MMNMNRSETENKKINDREKGIATLPTILVLTALVMAVGMLISALGSAQNSASAAWTASASASDYARFGARDGLLRVARNKNLSTSYDLPIAAGGCAAPFAGCASVSVAAGSNPKKITSTGRVGVQIRKVIVDATIDSNGQITGFNWTEL